MRTVEDDATHAWPTRAALAIVQGLNRIARALDYFEKPRRTKAGISYTYTVTTSPPLDLHEVRAISAGRETPPRKTWRVPGPLPEHVARYVRDLGAAWRDYEKQSPAWQRAVQCAITRRTGLHPPPPPRACTWHEYAIELGRAFLKQGHWEGERWFVNGPLPPAVRVGNRRRIEDAIGIEAEALIEADALRQSAPEPSHPPLTPIQLRTLRAVDKAPGRTVLRRNLSLHQGPSRATATAIVRDLVNAGYLQNRGKTNGVSITPEGRQVLKLWPEDDK